MATRANGNKGYIKVGTNIVHVMGWELTDEVDDEDSTTTEDNGYENVESVINRASASADGVVDMDQFPSNSPNPNIRAGQVATLELFVDDPADDQKFSFSSLIKSVQYTSRVKSLLKFSANFKSKGALTYPTIA